MPRFYGSGLLEQDPILYEQDDMAKGDSVLLFTLLDRDFSGKLDLKEVLEARMVLLNHVGEKSQIGVTIDQILNGADTNNDGKVNLEEWHDFQRSVYEVLGRRKWLEIVRKWRAELYDRNKELRAEENAKDQLRVPSRSTTRKHSREVARCKSSSGAAKHDSAKRIQAHVRGRQVRTGTTSSTPIVAKARSKADGSLLKEAKGAGRHLIAVTSMDAEMGTRADFHLDGVDIRVGPESGDIGRGVQVVTIDPDRGAVVKKWCYDTIHPYAEAECAKLAQDFAAIPAGYIVLVAVKGAGSKDLNQEAIAALRSVGASSVDLGRIETSFALIGCKGGKACAEAVGGKAEAVASVSFDKSHRLY